MKLDMNNVFFLLFFLFAVRIFEAALLQTQKLLSSEHNGGAP